VRAEVPVAVTLHERLRSATRRLHLEAERALDVERSFASRSAYTGLLTTLYALHEAYERALATLDLSTVGIDLVIRRRAHWLADDLTSLDQKLPEPATLAHRPQSIEAGLGALYVLEGSNLGGLILLRTATQLPGITTTRGARFFSGYGERTQAMWNELVQTLNGVPAHGDAAARIEAAAAHTFREFIGAFAAREGVMPRP
jgi:heme oxygenase